MLRSKYENDVRFLVGGDFNRLDINDILDSYGALRQIISVPTRKSATLEIILTDLHTLFHPPTTLPPLQVDSDKVGKDSDHDVVVLAPVSNLQYKMERKKKTITTRPLPESQIEHFEKTLMSHHWTETFQNLLHAAGLPGMYYILNLSGLVLTRHTDQIMPKTLTTKLSKLE